MARRPPADALTPAPRAADAGVVLLSRRKAVALAYAAAFAIPVVLDVALDVSGVATEDVGSSCRVLTAAGRVAFDAKVIWLQLALVGWALAGALLLARGWVRALEPSGVRWTVLGGWAAGSAAAAFAAWVGPASGGLLRLLLLVVYAPLVLVISGVLMLVPLIVRRARRQLVIPDALVVGCLAQLAVVLLAACVLGGSGEVELC
jgi:hypothetical protein